MTSDLSRPPGGAGEAIPAVLVTAPDRAGPGPTPVYDWLMVGRECPGVDERHRLLIDDPAVSRTHLELRLDLELDQAWLTDHSTNGTRLNGRRIERSRRKDHVARTEPAVAGMWHQRRPFLLSGVRQQ